MYSNATSTRSYKSAAPKMGIAPESGRRTFLVEGEPFTREKGKYPMAAPGFLDAVRKAMKRFERAGQAGLQPREPHAWTWTSRASTSRLSILPRPARCWAASSAIRNCSPHAAAPTTIGAPTTARKRSDRVKWAAILPMQDVSESIKEANRAAKNGAISFYVRPNPVRGRAIFHDDYLPLWAEVEKLGRPISTHDSGSASVESFGDRMDTHVTGHILSHPFEAMAAMAGLIWYGIIEKFPKLRVVQVEADGGWVPYWLQRMEQHWDFSGNSEHEYLSKRPTEYFKSNFFVAFRGDEPTMKAALDIVGDNNFLWDTDYPHPDGTFPWGIDALLKQSIPYSSKKKILWDNATQSIRLQLISTY